MITVLEHIGPAETPGANGLAVAYTGQAASVRELFSHHPSNPAAAVSSRSVASYPRTELAALLQRSHAALGAPEPCLAAAASLADPRSLCVLTGQQAGFLGGPLYTSYKIVTAIRTSRLLADLTGRPVVPVFWLASEDHDFQEINHAFSLDPSGEVRRLSFAWSGAGRPISDLPITSEVERTFRRYCEGMEDTIDGRALARSLSPAPGDTYCSWNARLVLRAFGRYGLLVVEPRQLSQLAAPFLSTAFARTGQIREALGVAAGTLRERGFTPALDPEQAGVPFRYAADGMRVRSARDPALASLALREPGAFSADAALRPVLQDTVFPTAVSVLGPGEIAYQAMLRPLYELFGVPQPLLLPRLAMTLMTEREAEVLSRCRLSFRSVTASRFALLDALGAAVSTEERAVYQDLRDRLVTAFDAVTDRVASVDPNLRITAGAARTAAERAVSRLEQRSYRALLARTGLSARDVLSLRGALYPRGSLQERVFPLPFALHRHGAALTDALFGVGDPLDFRHHLAVAPRR